MLLELERSMRSINREVINPEIKELTIDGLRPLIRLIAQARARYLRALFELGDKNSGQTPDARQLEELGRLRHALYEAERGIRMFPKKHTFHYMFAVVALDLEDRLEEAYERAKLAAELDPKNQGCKDTVEKIGRLIGK